MDSQRGIENEVVIVRTWIPRKGVKNGFGHTSLEIPSKGRYASALPDSSNSGRLVFANSLQQDELEMSHRTIEGGAKIPRKCDKIDRLRGLDINAIVHRLDYIQSNRESYTFAYYKGAMENPFWGFEDDAKLEDGGKVNCVGLVNDLLRAGGFRRKQTLPKPSANIGYLIFGGNPRGQLIGGGCSFFSLLFCFSVILAALEISKSLFCDRKEDCKNDIETARNVIFLLGGLSLLLPLLLIVYGAIRACGATVCGEDGYLRPGAFARRLPQDNSAGTSTDPRAAETISNPFYEPGSNINLQRTV